MTLVVTRYLKGGRVPVSGRIPPLLRDWLDAFGLRVNRNRSELLEEAVGLLKEKHEPDAKPANAKAGKRT